MTQPTPPKRGPGRPKLTEEEAWRSAEERVMKYITKQFMNDDGSVCYIYGGPWNLQIADGKRTNVNAQRVIAKRMDKDIFNPLLKVVATCHHRRCVSPDHIKMVERWPESNPRPVSVAPVAAPVIDERLHPEEGVKVEYVTPQGRVVAAGELEEDPSVELPF